MYITYMRERRDIMLTPEYIFIPLVGRVGSYTEDISKIY